jgi:hypothetical protein
VHRALAPLVDNARRHARSRVAIELSADAGHVCAAVRDDDPAWTRNSVSASSNRASAAPAKHAAPPGGCYRWRGAWRTR